MKHDYTLNAINVLQIFTDPATVHTCNVFTSVSH